MYELLWFFGGAAAGAIIGIGCILVGIFGD